MGLPLANRTTKGTWVTMHKPMLASDVPDNMPFPVLASYKLDGIRATGQDGKFRARSLKEIPNSFIQSHYMRLIDSMDGELIVGKENEEGTFRRTTSGVMSKDGEPDFTFNVFDCFDIEGDFNVRINTLKHFFHVNPSIPSWLKFVPHYLIEDRAELDRMLEHALQSGYEGIVVRKIEGHYKHGRSTKKEGLLLRLKPWEDAEAEILGFIEQQHNANEATINELGNTSRSTHQENMVGKDTLGAFIVKDLVTGVEFKIGNGKGLTHALRKEIWDNLSLYDSKIIKYRHLVVGGYDKPRLAQFIGFRDRIDMGE